MEFGMEKEALIWHITDMTLCSSANRVAAEDAIYPSLAGMQMYDAPLVGFAAADDSLFTATFKQHGVIHPEYQAPEEWLPGAKTVISIFAPFTEEVRRSNRQKEDAPYAPGIPQRCSAPWLHARIEGQLFLNRLTDAVQEFLQQQGFAAVCPATSGRLRMITPYISTWSERHAAYAAGLGTFSLSRGIITKKGMAGRLASVITDAPFLPDARPYSDPFAYCTMCGACGAKCPVDAIRKERGILHGKEHIPCDRYLAEGNLPPHGAHQRIRYGCGKCQCGVPCESGIPKGKNRA